MASFPGQKAGAAPTAPTTPSNLIANPLPSATQIQLQWNASKDGDLSISYIVTRCSGAGCTNFTALATTAPNSVNYVDSGLSVNTSYSYVVQAVDGAGNLSGLSNIATAVTPPLPQTLASISTTNTGNRWPLDTWAAQGGARRAAVLAPVLAPSIPANFSASAISSSEIDLSWSASTEPNVAISLYTIVISPGNITAQVSAPATTFKDTGLTASTTYTYTLSATDVHGNTSGTTQTSATTQAGVSPLSSPRVGIVAYGGDQGYGQPTTSGFTSYTASVPGTAAYTAMQQLGAYDIALINGSFESWGTSSSGRTKSNLVQAIKGKGNFPNIINSVRSTFVFLYSIMESAQNLTSGAAYQGYSTQIINNNWWLYPTAGGSGTPVGSAASGTGWFDVDYTYFYPVAPSGFTADTSVTGNVYGSLSSGQNAAQTAATYFSTALLSTNRSDARFSSLPLNGSAPNADGLFLDNCFIYPNGGGNLSPSTASWDGVSTQSNTAIGPYTGNSGSPVSSMLARGQLRFFQQYQSFLANVNPGSVYYNMANFGGFADITSFGNTHTAVSSAIDNTFHGGLLEEVAGVAGPSWQSFRTWAQVLANINNAVAYCQPPQLVLVGVKLPASDGSTTASFFTGGANVTVTGGTALEYQFLRCMLCATLMTNAIFATGTSTYNYSVTRYYDEFGDDSLTQVNVKKGYLGIPTSAVPTAAAFSNGVWGRLYPNAVVLFNPWSNGAQTVTAAQMTTLYGHNFLTLKGTQQTAVNAGRAFTAFTFGDGDGLILMIDTAAALSITTTSLPGATVGSAYTTSITATGGTAPYTYAITSDTPDTGSWLSINSATGALSGTPGTAETESVTFQVTDSLGRVSPTKTLSIVVSASGGSGFTPSAGITFSGTVANGNTLTMNKASGGLGTKPFGAKPAYCYKYESNLLPDPVWSRTQTANTPDPTSSVQTSIKPPGAAGAAQTAAGDNSLYDDPIQMPNVNGLVYCAQKFYANHEWDQSNSVQLKSFRIWSTFGGNATTFPDAWWGSNTEIIVDNLDQAFNFYSSIGGTRPNCPENTWVLQEYLYSDGTLNTANGVRNLWANGLLCYPQNVAFSNINSGTNGWTNITSSFPQLKGQVFYGQYSNVGTIGTDYYGFTYIDDSFFRLVVSNEPTLSFTSAVRELQIPTSWSDTSVSFILREGSFSSFSGLFLWLYTGPYTAILLGKFN